MFKDKTKTIRILSLLIVNMVILFGAVNVNAATTMMSKCNNYTYTTAYYNLVKMVDSSNANTEIHLMYTTDGKLVYCSELGRALWLTGDAGPIGSAYIVTEKTGAYELMAKALAYGYNSNENVDAGGNNQWNEPVSCTGQEERIATQMLIHMINKDYNDGGIPWETYTKSNIENFIGSGSSTGISKIASYFVEIRDNVLKESKTPSFSPKTVALTYDEASHTWKGTTTDTAKVLQEGDWKITNSGSITATISGNTINLSDKDGTPTSGAITLGRSIYDTGTIYKSSYDDKYQETIYYISAEPTTKTLQINYTMEQVGKGKIQVMKTDKYTGKPISGVTFGIYQDNQCSVKAKDYLGNELADKTTGKLGIVEWDNLYYPLDNSGQKIYYVKELSAPEGYTVDSDLLTALKANGGCIPIEIKPANEDVGATNIEAQTLYNIPYGNITIMKRDVDTDEVIEGVEFRLLKHVPDAENNPAVDIHGNIVENVVTGPNGVAEFKDIPYGDYILEEVSTNGSYEILKEPIEFTLNEENDALKFESQGTEALPEQTIYRVGDIDNDGALLESDLTLLENFLAGEISLTKIQRLAADVNGDNKVNSTDKDMIEKHINQETPLENALEEKTYEEEFVPLETYRVGDPTDDGKIDSSDVTIIEGIINGVIEEVTAKQRYASDVNRDEQVTEVDKDLVISYIEGSTDSIPNALEEKVIPGQYQKRVTLTVTNVPIDIKISKYEIAKEKELKGAKIKILNSEGEVFYEYTSKGEREEFGISTGEYTLIEEISPNGYENLRVEIKFRVGTDGNIEILSEKSSMYTIKETEREVINNQNKVEIDKDMDHIIIYNKLKEVEIPNTASTITVVGIIIGAGLIGYGGYQVYRRYRTVS